MYGTKTVPFALNDREIWFVLPLDPGPRLFRFHPHANRPRQCTMAAP